MENVIMFEEIPDIVTDFKREFDNTITECDRVTDSDQYIIDNKPQYSQDLSSYISYDILFQAKLNENLENYVKAKALAPKSVNIENTIKILSLLSRGWK